MTVSGAIDLYATEPHAFDDATIAVARAFAGYAGLAMANACLESTRAAISDGMAAAMDPTVQTRSTHCRGEKGP